MAEQAMNHDFWMAQALELARHAESLDEVPVGAIVVKDEVIIGKGWNHPIASHDPTAHAEIMAIRDAARNVNNYRLPGATLYVTLEPCTMCAGAIIHSRIETLVYAATEPKSGAVLSTNRLLEHEHFNHRVNIVSGVLSEESAALISGFFARRRAEKKALRSSRSQA